jgi:hypothetical protein
MRQRGGAAAGVAIGGGGMGQEPYREAKIQLRGSYAVFVEKKNCLRSWLDSVATFGMALARFQRPKYRDALFSSC